MADDVPHTVHFQVPQDKKKPVAAPGDTDRYYNASDSYDASVESSKEGSGHVLSRQNSEKTPLMMSSRDLSVGISE